VATAAERHAAGVEGKPYGRITFAHVCARDDAEAGSTQIAAFGAVNAEQRTTKHAAQIRLIYARL
jgi:hypothetical protein